MGQGSFSSSYLCAICTIEDMTCVLICVLFIVGGEGKGEGKEEGV